MSESTLFAPEVGSALSFLERTSAWDESPPTPENAETLELQLVSAVQQARALELAWSLCTRQGEFWETVSYRQRLRSLEFLSETVADIMTRTRQLLARLRRKNLQWVPPAAAAEIEPMSKMVSDVRAKVTETLRWLDRARPPVNEDMVRDSREFMARMEGEEIGAVIARLKNGGPLVKE